MDSPWLHLLSSCLERTVLQPIWSLIDNDCCLITLSPVAILFLCLTTKWLVDGDGSGSGSVCARAAADREFRALSGDGTDAG